MTIARNAEVMTSPLPLNAAEGVAIEGLSQKKACMQQNSRTVLFLPRHPTSWQKMSLIAEVVSKSGRYRPLFLLACEPVIGYSDECKRLGFDYLIAASARVDPMKRPRVLRVWRLLRRQYAEFRKLLQNINPVAIVVPGDRELWPVPTMLRAAKDLGVAVLNAAYSVAASDAVAQNRFGLPEFRVEREHKPPLVNYVAAHLHPGQVRETPFGKMLFSPGWLTLTLGAVRMLPLNPWVQGGGNSTYLLVNGPQVAEDAIGRGVPQHKIRMIGDPAVDVLHERWSARSEIRNELCDEHRFVKERKLVICAVPIYAEHKLTDWDTHLTGLDRAFAAMASQDANILLSFHPKSNVESYRHLLEKYHLKYTSRVLRDILPAADIFVCGGSSTLFWAGYCGIPTINLDYAGVSSVGTQSTEGTILARTAEDVSSSLSRWIGVPVSYRQAVAAQQEDYGAQALFDGCSAGRLIALLDELRDKGRDRPSRN